MDRFYFRKLTISDESETKKFILTHYVTKEPRCVHLKVASDEFWNYYGPLVQICLSHNVSIGAFNRSSGEMSAFILNMLGRGKAPQFPPFETQPLKIRQLIKFRQAVVEGGIEAGVGTDNYLRLAMTAVKQEYAQLGLFTEFGKRSHWIAEKLSCDYIVAEYSNQYTLQMAIRGGCKMKNQIFYKDYVDPITGLKIFEAMAEPHKSHAWMVFPVHKARI